MAYQAPSFERFKQIAEYLIATYKNGNSERENYINLFNKLVEKLSTKSPLSQQILMGFLIFTLETIKQEYKHAFWTSYKNSSLYTTILVQLNLDSAHEEKTLSNSERVIYLYQLHKHLPQILKDQDLAYLHWGDINTLAKEIKIIIEEILEKEHQRIKTLKKGEIPNLVDLQNNIENLHEVYNNNNQVHCQLLNFIEVINQSCAILYPKEAFNIHDANYIHSQNAQSGALLYALEEINKEYAFFSPGGTIFSEGSKLYKECLAALEKDDLKNINNEQKIEWLRALSIQITRLQNEKSCVSLLAECQLNYPGVLEKHQDNLEKYLEQYETNIGQPSWLVKKTANYAANYLLTHSFRQCFFKNKPSWQNGLAGLVVYNAGALVMAQTGIYLSPALSLVFIYVLEKIGQRLSEQTSNLTAYAFSATENGFKHLWQILTNNNNEAEKIHDAMIALIEAQDIPEQQKLGIQRLLLRETNNVNEGARHSFRKLN